MVNIILTKNAAQATAITHNGEIHASEVFSTVILSKVFDNMILCRTHKVPEYLPENVIVYNIGSGKFGHYPLNNGFRKNGVPYATCGLIWREFGKKFLQNHTYSYFEYDETDEESQKQIDKIWSIIDHILIQGIDVTPVSGMPQADYPAQLMNVSQLISAFNSNWDDSYSLPNSYLTPEDRQFLDALDLAESIFEHIVKNVFSKVCAQAAVEKAIENSEGNIMILDRYVHFWQDYFFTSSNPKTDDIKFVVFPSKRSGYSCQCVPIVPYHFRGIKDLPTAWVGLSGTALQNVSGIKTAISCSLLNGYLFTAETREDAIAAAKLALEA